MVSNHFFQPLLPGFLSNFVSIHMIYTLYNLFILVSNLLCSIPKSFLKNLQERKEKDSNTKIVKLRDKQGRIWEIKAIPTDFAKEHDLANNCGEHLGNFIFDVTILDGTGCESELPTIIEDEELQEKKRASRSTNQTKSATRRNRKLGDGDGDGLMVRDFKKKICASLRSNNGRPYFSSIVTPSNLTSGITAIPKQFAIKNGLTRRWCDIKLRDDKGQSRRMKLRFSKESGCSYIYSRPTLYEPYDLVRGDIIIFELIDNGKNPAMKFYKLQTNED
ncbi:B3 domain-containing protein REM8-like [Beta vulgaris subsp. vulgaris]|uniref:B3 domain-containing protein REM8-like n=1 Tax=Beta vulgaris subsp. vulgaris TaxID=3555 RepID=UPI002036F83E|nr:B3 domain-containing protein REM8-like [Beta vulgaris subsp. vulgaris]